MRQRNPSSRVRYRWPAVALVAVWAATGAFAGPPERGAFTAPRPAGLATLPMANAELRQELTAERPADQPAVAAAPKSFNKSGTFMSAYLLPRMAARLGGFNGLVGSEIYQNQPVESVWRGEVDRRIEKQAIRATRAAAREYLIERWNLELDLNRGRATVAGEETSDNNNARSSKLRLGFAGARPRVTWLTDTKNGEVKFSVDTRGRFGAAWHHAADGKTGFAFAADPSNKRVEIGWANAF